MAADLPTFFDLPWIDGGVRPTLHRSEPRMHDYYTEDGAKLCLVSSKDAPDEWWFTPGTRPDGSKPYLIWLASDPAPELPHG